MGKAWSDEAIRNLIDWTKCPRCEFSPLNDGWCGNCGADLNGPAALTLANASEAAVAALQARERALESVPVLAKAAAANAAAVVAAPASAASVPVTASAPRPTSQLSVQSVLAVAGAGMVAVAAIIFTFINSAITDDVTRYSIIAAVTVVFLGAAWLMARARLQFSAEAVGALGMVFVVIDIWAIATKTDSTLSDYGIAAIATVVASALMIGLASIRRLRTWLWAGVLGLVITPILVGFAVNTAWALVLGSAAVVFVALAAHELLHPLERRFSSKLRADHVSATGYQFAGLVLVLSLLFTVPDDTATRFIAIAGVLAALGVASAFATRNGITVVWSYLAGALFAAAAALLPSAATYEETEWLIALAPAAAFAAAVALASFSLLATKQPVGRDPLLAGALTVAFITVVPATFTIAAQAATVIGTLVEPVTGAAAVIGAVAAANGLAVIAFARRSRAFATLTVIFAVGATIGVSTWAQFTDLTKLSIALGAAVAIAAALAWLKPVASVRAGIRVPLLIGAHLLLGLGIVISWADEPLTIIGGLAIVAAFAALAFAMPRAVQPVHVALALTYGLIVFAYTLVTQTDLSDFAVLGLTATLGLAAALFATAVRAIAVRFYYAVLAVAALPFVASVAVTLAERSGWTGVAVAAAFVLALMTVLVRRPGLTVAVRAAAASLLLPTLSVVVIDVVPQLIIESASPIVLPVIAGLVAATLPSTVWIGAALQRLGHGATDAKAVQLALEISALVTGAIAALLTVTQSASGAGTTFIVLTIIGIGAAATGQFVHRRYAWYAAYVSFTGALWALLALNSVDQVESYVLPPAIVAALIGVYAVARGARGLVFYIAGLSVAVATSLGVLVWQGNPDGALEVRAYALLAASLVLSVVSWLLTRIPATSPLAALTRLHATTLWVAIGAAAAGAIQAMRYGFGIDLSTFGSGAEVLVPVLSFSGGAAALALLAGWLLARTHARLASSRWVYAPALVLLALGPISSLRHDATYPLTMLALMLLILGFMIATAVLARRRPAITLPPVWFTFAVAWCVGVAGWAERDTLRVEAYSIAMGLALLAVGIIAMRPVKDAVARFSSWPIGFQGSWPLLAPGIVVTLIASVISTGTDPRTERAILVIVLALAAVLLGNLRKLAAPFILGIAALPIEIIIIFGTQIGTRIEATTLWITLATAGATLLVLAVSSERGTAVGGVAARLRDLK